MRATRWILCAALLAGCGDNDPAPEGAAEPPATKAEVAQANVDGKADWSLDPCERWGWYGDGACDWFCWDHDPDCDPSPLGPEPQGTATRFPIVLAHGFDASPTNRWGWYGVAEALRADGHAVHVASVPPYAPVATRAGYLARAIDEALESHGADQVHLVAHSMGGLDSRYVISTLGYGDRVVTLTTISSPHRGSYVTDVALKLTPELAEPALNALARAWGRTYSELADDTDLRGALNDLSEAAAPAFNAANPDDPRVKYLSWAGVSSPLGLPNPQDFVACDGKALHGRGVQDKMDATLVPMAAFAAHGAALAPNDGMVQVASARWGEFQGCIPADHLDEVGQVRDDGPDPYTGFDHVRFYRNLAFDLARREP
ncbi:MAG: triacylglycerol lipase [Myxococcales bacterium]|nr:triacylglycerol lipase [Myxococcales bacterium]